MSRTLHRRERRRTRASSRRSRPRSSSWSASRRSAIVHHGSDKRVRSRERDPRKCRRREITHIDVIVVPARRAVQRHARCVSARRPATRYAPRRDRRALLSTSRSSCALCALETNDGFAVDPSRRGAALPRRSRSRLGGAARSTTYREAFGFDTEVFLKVGAPAGEVGIVAFGARRRPRGRARSTSTPADAYDDLQEGFRRSAGTRPEHEAVGPAGVVPHRRQARRLAAAPARSIRNRAASTP